jgi:hypothetical protein
MFPTRNELVVFFALNGITYDMVMLYKYQGQIEVKLDNGDIYVALKHSGRPAKAINLSTKKIYEFLAYSTKYL